VLDAAEGELVVSAASLAGTVAAGVVGWLSIHYLLRFVRTHSLTVFCWYIVVFSPLSALVIWLR
jgi:undecaprenyl pyrophosphate phosphatase UppP